MINKLSHVLSGAGSHTVLEKTHTHTVMRVFKSACASHADSEIEEEDVLLCEALHRRCHFCVMHVIQNHAASQTLEKIN